MEILNINHKSTNYLFKRHLWIYGAGRVGKRLCNILESIGVCVHGLLVTSMADNITAYMGKPVREFADVRLCDKDVVLIALEGKARTEVVQHLKDMSVKFEIWTKNWLCDIWTNNKYMFFDRSKGNQQLCIVLCGYKEYLWEDVFDRLFNNIPDGVDVCLCSAGKYLESLSRIAENKDCSYLCIKKNSISLIQNLCISLHKNAKWIYKMDEDIFVTKNVFENLMDTATEIMCSTEYDFGLISPIIPLNASCYRFILEKYNVIDWYEEKFGKAKIGGGAKREIEMNPDTAKFMWGCGMPHLDWIANDLKNEKGYFICSTRLSIGFILFSRQLWEDMQGFIVYGNKDIGIDEEDINAFCINNSRIMAIAKNAIVGHFGFTKQTTAMKEFYNKHKERF